jgi:hypothetical protein
MEFCMVACLLFSSFLAGRFRGTKTQSFESLVHVTYGTPITVGLSFNR